MVRLSLACAIVLLACAAVRADDEARVATVKSAATKMAEATIKGDFATLIDLTADGIVKQAGGREKSIELAEAAISKLKAIGFKVEKYTVGEPEQFMTEGDNLFVVVPSSLEMASPQGTFVVSSYMIGISPDEGKTWKFADASSVKQNKAAAEKMLPKLPEGLKLPAEGQPMLKKND